MACLVECSCEEQTLCHANACDENCLRAETWIPTTSTAPNALSCGVFIAEKRPDDVAGEEDECREWEEQEGEGDEGSVLGEMEAIG